MKVLVYPMNNPMAQVYNEIYCNTRLNFRRFRVKESLRVGTFQPTTAISIVARVERRIGSLSLTLTPTLSYPKGL